MKLVIGWIYPRLMNVYGDRGNVITLQKRAQWRDIEVEIKYLDDPLDVEELSKCDLLMMGGAQDQQQEIVSIDLKDKGKFLKEAIDSEVPGIYVCGAYQFLGNYYKDADGTEISGLGIFDLHTINPGESTKRLIGNLAVETYESSLINETPFTLIGFENHGGRTYLGPNIKPLAKVIKGFGNNGEDLMEGAIYKNSIGTYMHGPILPKNPALADWLIQKALERKVGKKVELAKIDDTIENNARSAIAKRLSIKI
jgi:CobQ-like glutamine amidotransferase family enzyme